MRSIPLLLALLGSSSYLAAALVGVVLIATGTWGPSDGPYGLPPTSTPVHVASTPLPTSAQVRSVPTASEVEALVADSVMLQPEVVDSAVSKKGREVSLVLIVRYATNEARARVLGENAVRMYKSFSDDTHPGKSVGKGRYDYIIGVYYPNKKQVAFGAKVSFAEHISW